MSFAYDYGPAAQAPASERAGFIRRTYGHLAGAIMAFAILEILLLRLPGIENVVGGLISSWWLLMLAFIGVAYLAQWWAHNSPSPAMQYAGLGLYVVLEAVIFLPLLYWAKMVYPDAIAVAGILTGAVFGGLTMIVFMTRKDYSFLRPALFIGSWLLLGLCIAAIFFGPSFGLLVCFIGVALASGFILYDTSNVLHHYRTDQHVGAALQLFASVALLFWYILRIVMASRD
jgi:FtsH-binding integral membrane protein